MRIEGGRVKPCPTCIKARQGAVDMVRKLAGVEVERYTIVQFEDRQRLVIDNRSHTIAHADDRPELWGKRVYIAGRWLVDVASANRLDSLGRIATLSKSDSFGIDDNARVAV